MKFQKNHVITLHQRLIQFANENLARIEALELDPNDELDSTYVGMIIRQITLNSDLKLLLESKTHGYHTSHFILLRCLIDDFIHLTFIVNQEDHEEQIVKFNADALNKNFKKLMDLATLNEEKLGGEYPHYPTYELLDGVKEKMKNSPRRQQHFSDKENFTFKTFKATGNIIRDLGDNEYSHQLNRAYFIWRKLSDFVHYSNLSFEEEEMINPGEDYTYNEFAEIIFYSYNTTLNCLQHFNSRYGIEIIDTNNLKEYYADAGHP